ncbi:hypothetical protein JCM10908_004851 [Rhodotorula pacifica]|uniref:uncharacterized protein n=1 Tax=Rhodotorula pacifica TaxID=1495444 RepID=UPI003179080A
MAAIHSRCLSWAVTTALSLLLLVVDRVAAQQINPDAIGYGRVSCTNIDGSPNDAYCETIGMAGCSQDFKTGNYFCGINEVACDGTHKCDGPDSTCLFGRCASFGCLGKLQVGPPSAITFIDACGAPGAACGQSDYLCSSNLYCVASTGLCSSAARRSEGASCADDTSSCQLDLTCDATTLTCIAPTTSTVGGSCSVRDSQCNSPLYCRQSDKTCQQKATVSQSCAADPLFGCASYLYCAALDDTCQIRHTNERASCSTYSDSCAAPLYCSTTDAATGYQQQCLKKVGEGSSCQFDPVNGCSDGLYCTTTDQTCRTRGTAVGASCAFDPTNACGLSSDDGSQLYCIAATGKCGKKGTSVGADCTADPIGGCGATSTGAGLFCDGSVCQLQVTAVGGSCASNAIAACGTSTTDGPLYCSQPSNLCQAKLSSGGDCSSNPSAACLDPLYCTSNTHICTSKVNTNGGFCDLDPYAQCGFDSSLVGLGFPRNGGLAPSIVVASDGNQHCFCTANTVPAANAAPFGSFSLAAGAACTSDPFCGYASDGAKLYCAKQTHTCQQHVTTVGGRCDYDRLGACGVTTDGSRTQLYPSTSNGACTCVLQANVIVAPSARARARSRRAVSVCPDAQTACSVGLSAGYECIDTESNLEQCGGCINDGGVDCTALVGVAAVGCVAGRCEVWACEDGFAFEPVSEQCVRG